MICILLAMADSSWAIRASALSLPDWFSTSPWILARIHTLSGMAAKGIGLSVSQGIIDSDYVEKFYWR